MRPLPLHALRTHAPWGVHAPCFREGPLSTLTSRDYDLLPEAAREKRKADTCGKRTESRSANASAIVVEDLGEILNWETSWSTCTACFVSDKKPGPEEPDPGKWNSRLHCAIDVDFRPWIRSLPLTTNRQPDVAGDTPSKLSFRRTSRIGRRERKV